MTDKKMRNITGNMYMYKLIYDLYAKYAAYIL